MKPFYDYLVLGAGISGLSAGYGLLKKEKDFAVLEGSSRSGGVIESEIRDGLMIEHGPNSMASTPDLEVLLDELDLTAEILHAKEESKIRQILWDDQLHTLKASPLTLLTTKLLSPSAKLRILKEPFIKSKSTQGESVLDFFTRRFGSQVAQRMAGAIVSGIYAGEASQLEMAAVFPRFVELEKEYGSLLKGLQKSTSPGRKIISFKRGMETVGNALSRKLNYHLHLNTSISSIEKKGAGWEVSCKDGTTIQTNNIISTLPYRQLKPLLNPLGFPDVAIPYHPMLTLQVQVALSSLKSNTEGFGFLASSFERSDFIGVLFNGNVFDTAIAGNRALMTFFVRPDRCKEKDPSRIFEDLCVPLLRKWTGITGYLKLVHHRFWNEAIPQKTIGHLERLTQLQKWESNHPGFQIAGNFVHGVSVGDCITEHKNLVERLVQHAN